MRISATAPKFSLSYFSRHFYQCHENCPTSCILVSFFFFAFGRDPSTHASVNAETDGKSQNEKRKQNETQPSQPTNHLLPFPRIRVVCWSVCWIAFVFVLLCERVGVGGMTVSSTQKSKFGPIVISIGALFFRILFIFSFLFVMSV